MNNILEYGDEFVSHIDNAIKRSKSFYSLVEKYTKRMNEFETNAFNNITDKLHNIEDKRSFVQFDRESFHENVDQLNKILISKDINDCKDMFKILSDTYLLIGLKPIKLEKGMLFNDRIMYSMKQKNNSLVSSVFDHAYYYENHQKRELKKKAYVLCDYFDLYVDLIFNDDHHMIQTLKDWIELRFDGNALKEIQILYDLETGGGFVVDFSDIDCQYLLIQKQEKGIRLDIDQDAEKEIFVPFQNIDLNICDPIHDDSLKENLEIIDFLDKQLFKIGNDHTMNTVLSRLESIQKKLRVLEKNLDWIEDSLCAIEEMIIDLYVEMSDAYYAKYINDTLTEDDIKQCLAICEGIEKIFNYVA